MEFECQMNFERLVIWILVGLWLFGRIAWNVAGLGGIRLNFDWIVEGDFAKIFITLGLAKSAKCLLKDCY